MQQPTVMEEGTAYEPPTYDETFPVLPESTGTTTSSSSPNPSPSVNNSMRVGCSVVTHVRNVFLFLSCRNFLKNHTFENIIAFSSSLKIINAVY